MFMLEMLGITYAWTLLNVTGVAKLRKLAVRLDDYENVAARDIWRHAPHRKQFRTLPIC